MKQIFINLPVSDVEASMNFYLALGFTMNRDFSSRNQKCMIWSDHIYVMLQSQAMFTSHIHRQVPNLKTFQTASHTLPVESLDRVNEIIESGLGAGGTEPVSVIDEGFMQIRTIEDPDGHTWDFIYLDKQRFLKQQSATSGENGTS